MGTCSLSQWISSFTSNSKATAKPKIIAMPVPQFPHSYPWHRSTVPLINLNKFLTASNGSWRSVRAFWKICSHQTVMSIFIVERSCPGHQVAKYLALGQTSLCFSCTNGSLTFSKRWKLQQLHRLCAVSQWHQQPKHDFFERDVWVPRQDNFSLGHQLQHPHTPRYKMKCIR